mmetsp:Transcript_36524/g.96372  ORF Transcript_36524/g.96372 Transcript_36524/m.96372 type:complete len:311 (-) Transcript_36524:1161-2093(-)
MQHTSCTCLHALHAHSLTTYHCTQSHSTLSQHIARTRVTTKSATPFTHMPSNAALSWYESIRGPISSHAACPAILVCHLRKGHAKSRSGGRRPVAGHSISFHRHARRSIGSSASTIHALVSKHQHYHVPRAASSPITVSALHLRLRSMPMPSSGPRREPRPTTCECRRPRGCAAMPSTPPPSAHKRSPHLERGQASSETQSNANQSKVLSQIFSHSSVEVIGRGSQSRPAVNNVIRNRIRDRRKAAPIGHAAVPSPPVRNYRRRPQRPLAPVPSSSRRSGLQPTRLTTSLMPQAAAELRAAASQRACLLQ